MAIKQYLFETEIKRLVDVVEHEKKEENGETIEIKKTVQKPKAIKIAILKPDRKLFKGAEIFYARTLSDYLKAGLMPYSLVSKRYANDGGPLTDEDKEKLKGLKDEAIKLESEFFGLIDNNQPDEIVKEKKNQLLIKINKINEEVNTISNSYADIFDSTAEMKARGDTMEWWSLFLIYINENDKDYIPLFSEGSYENRLEKLEEYENKSEPFYNEVIRRLSYLISFWFTARNTISKIDFDTMEKLYIDTISNYKLPEEKTSIKVNNLTPASKTE